jgi:hypothetical protein
VRIAETVTTMPMTTIVDVPLAELRARLHPDQLKLVNRIWQMSRDSMATAAPGPSRAEPWVSKGRLHVALGDSTLVTRMLDDIGGSIVLALNASGNEPARYSLTLLGASLTDDGQTLVGTLVRYLAYCASRYRQDPDLRKIHSTDVRNALELSEEDCRELSLCLRLPDSPWFVCGESHSGWTGSMPQDIDAINDSRDVARYVHDLLAKAHAPSMPIDGHARLQYSASRRPGRPSSFAFLSDPKLRRQLDSDWAEAQSVHHRDVAAWKACVVLCGGVVEGVLLAALREREADAVATSRLLKTNDGADLEDWSLATLVLVSRRLGLISAATERLADALRVFRNLIHPARHVREGTTVDRGSADIAVSVVRKVIAEVTARMGKQQADSQPD